MSKSPASVAALADLFQYARVEILSAGGQALVDSFDADLDVSPSDADPRAEMRALPRKLLKWCLLAAAAEHALAEARMKLDDLRARLDARVRAEFTEAKVKSTEPMVTAAIDSSPDWHGGLRSVHAAEARARVIADTRDILRHRKDILLAEVAARQAAGTEPKSLLPA